MTNKIILTLLFIALLFVVKILISDRKQSKAIYREKSSDYLNQEPRK